MRIVLTGGIGSGKSVVARMLKDWLPTYTHCSVGEIVDRIYQTPEMQNELLARFGTYARTELSEMAFNDRAVKTTVEALFKGHVRKEMARFLDENENLIMEFPLLFERGTDFMRRFDLVVSVVAERETRIARAMARDGRAIDRIEMTIASQVSDDERMAKSDFVIENNGDAYRTADQVRELANRAKYHAARGRETGIVSGSFDPITHGHAWVIKQALRLMDCVVVAVAQNPDKKPMFPATERASMIWQALKESLDPATLQCVAVEVIPADELLVNFAKSVNADFIIRGLRNLTDFQAETHLNLVQKKLAPEVEILYVITPREIAEVSSSLVKSVLNLRDWERVVQPVVSSHVFEQLKRRRTHPVD